ncbi:hypothetical protein [Streptacidiphilus albus]|uniref:hypothetical protein n=1 Tax=Streptacidiphilus albus TaxID=105425 RepID=UPI00054BB9DD|nr:hypothetical protein [Streptacidiphilus albus]
MPARRRTLAATTAVLAAGTANAAPAPATSNVRITVGAPAPTGALVPDGSAETFTGTPTNNLGPIPCT